MMVVLPSIRLRRSTAFDASRIPRSEIVERAFGVLEVHSDNQADVRAAGEAILRYHGLTEEDRLTPRVVTSEIITGTDAYQTMLINHYGLNVRDPEAKKMLTENLEKFLFSTGDTEQVDTSKQGTINW